MLLGAVPPWKALLVTLLDNFRSPLYWHFKPISSVQNLKLSQQLSWHAHHSVQKKLHFGHASWYWKGYRSCFLGDTVIHLSCLPFLFTCLTIQDVTLQKESCAMDYWVKIVESTTFETKTTCLLHRSRFVSKISDKTTYFSIIGFCLQIIWDHVD